MTTSEQPRTHWPRGVKIVYWVVLVAIATVATLLRLSDIYFIPSEAMEPTIANGDRVLVWPSDSAPERGDIIVFDPPSGMDTSAQLLKRVVGLSGETIDFRDGRVYIDGSEIIEPYLAEQASTQERLAPTPIQIPAGHVFVMGDNRGSALDSRVYGSIPISDVQGVYQFTLPPPF